MSEVRYRRPMGWLRFGHDFMQFTGALLESHLPLFDQLRMILALDDLEMNAQAVRLIHVLSIHELAPDLMRVFKTVDAFEGQSLKKDSLLALIRLRHEEIYPFLLALLRDSGDNSYRTTASKILWVGGNIRPELVPHFSDMASDVSELIEIRCHAIAGMLRHGGSAPVMALLIPLLQDDSGEVRWTALRAFERHGNAGFASALKPLINDDYQADKAVPNGVLARSILRKWTKQEDRRCPSNPLINGHLKK